MQHPTRKAHRKTVLERCEQIHREMQADRLRRQIIKGMAADMEIDLDDCREVYADAAK